MQDQNLHAQLEPLYSTYNSVVKPLIADIEARTETFPQPVFNEIRAVNDHVARCFASSATNRSTQKEIQKAYGHIERIILDCYKILNIYFFDSVQKFEKRVKNIDFTTIDNGRFYVEFNELRKISVSTKNAAKLAEGLDKEKSIKLYEEVYNHGVKLNDLITANEVHIQRCIKKYRKNKVWSVGRWIIGIVIGAVATTIIQEIIEYINIATP